MQTIEHVSSADLPYYVGSVLVFPFYVFLCLLIFLRFYRLSDWEIPTDARKRVLPTIALFAASVVCAVVLFSFPVADALGQVIRFRRISTWPIFYFFNVFFGSFLAFCFFQLVGILYYFWRARLRTHNQ